MSSSPGCRKSPLRNSGISQYGGTVGDIEFDGAKEEAGESFMTFQGMEEQSMPCDGRWVGGRRPAAILKRRVEPRGFTLIEIMITIFLLVVALLGIVSTSVIVMKTNSFSKTMTTATTLAKAKMEVLKNTDYDSLTGGTETVESVFTRTWTVTNNTPATDMKTIEVNVTWTWQAGANPDHPSFVNLRSIVAKK
jgi:prepilin-type N-terminal cleavage/methylation domain-containing protein